MTSQQSILNSAYQAYSKGYQVAELNLARQEDKKYIAVEGIQKATIVNGQCYGFQMDMIQKIDEDLFKELRTINSSTSGFDKKLKCQEKLNRDLFGDKTHHLDLSHMAQKIIDQLNVYKNNPTNPSQKNRIVNAIFEMTDRLQKMSQSIQSARSTADEDLNNAVQNVNRILKDIGNCNREIQKVSFKKDEASIFEVKNKKRDLFHELSTYFDITENQLNLENGEHFTLHDQYGHLLVSNTDVASFIFEPTGRFSTKTTGNPVIFQSIAGNKETLSIDKFQNLKGEFSSLIDLRDRHLTGMQREIDAYAVTLRDQMNAIHNRGLSQEPPNILISSTTIPNSFENPDQILSLSENTIFSGKGTLRLGVVDKTTGQLIDEASIKLSDQMTLGNLMTSINQLNLEIHAEFTQDGRFQLSTADFQKGILIGNPEHNPPLISSSSNFDEDHHFGFSHFFGFNNLLESNHSLGGSFDGIAETLQLRQDIRTNPETLSSGVWRDTISKGQQVLLPGEMSTIEALSTLFETKTPFPSSDLSAHQVTSFMDYSDRFVRDCFDFKKNLENKIEIQQDRFLKISEQVENVSGVNPQLEFQNAITYAMGISRLLKIIEMNNQLDKKLLEIL